MDSKAHLALMAKAQKVFESDDSFLAFPVTPLVYDRNDLDLSLTGSSAEEVLAKRQNIEAFSLLVNLIPEGNAWIPSESRFLWDEYGHVLNQGSCASSTRTPEEEVKYQAARDYLKDIDADGIERDSPQVVLYKQHQDAWASVREEFEEARLSHDGEFAEEETVRKQWKEVAEPAFRERLASVERKWVLDGHKNDVELKQNELLTLGAKSPLATWLDWKASFDPSIDSQTGASSHLEVFPTSFSPANALDDGNWKSFQLDSTTIEALVAQAPAELKERFNVGSAKTNIDSMNLEFSMGLLNRHWFNRDVLHSRFWRLPDGSKVLSDGGAPADGDCPSYVSGVVFARHVTVKEKPPGQSSGSSTNPPTTQLPLRPVGPLHLEFSQLTVGRPVATRINPELLQTIQPVRLKPVTTRPGSRGARVRTPVMATATLARPSVMAARPLATLRPARPGINPALVRPLPGIQVRPNNVALRQLAKQRTFRRLEIARPVPGSGVRPPPPPPPPESNPDEIQILAFICKRVPKCPDPDSSLAW